MSLAGAPTVYCDIMSRLLLEECLTSRGLMLGPIGQFVRQPPLEAARSDWLMS